MTHSDQIYLSLRSLTEYLDGRSRASIYRDISEGRLPPPIKLGASSRWLKSEVDAKLAEAADRRGEAA
jgi:predicted DNA-binding transcriptional regulator AlpA